jgi:hypothetical protein
MEINRTISLFRAIALFIHFLELSIVPVMLLMVPVMLSIVPVVVKKKGSRLV